MLLDDIQHAMRRRITVKVVLKGMSTPVYGVFLNGVIDSDGGKIIPPADDLTYNFFILHTKEISKLDGSRYPAPVLYGSVIPLSVNEISEVTVYIEYPIPMGNLRTQEYKVKSY